MERQYENSYPHVSKTKEKETTTKEFNVEPENVQMALYTAG